MRKWILLFVLLPLLQFAKAPQLSSKAEIYIVTCGPYQGELYSAFGHSAVRVFDPVNGYNIIFNYGVFDFNQPNFYLNFTKGQLNYQLATTYYDSFLSVYVRENRFVHEQALNLRQDQKQKVFDFLEWNARPENKNYFYDYFHNNCATKIKDALKDIFQDSLVMDLSYIDTEYSIRDLMDLYLDQQPWGDFGIDLCLGMTIDKPVDPEVYMYLPDYIESGLNHSYIINKKGEKEPLIKETVVSYSPTEEAEGYSWNQPFTIFSILLILGIFITYLGSKRDKNYFALDISLFTFIGILGWLLSILWLFTDHKAAAYNLNVIWALPFHFPIALMLLKSNKPKFLKGYFKITAVLYVLLLLNWAWLPQNLHNGLIPFVILLLIRSVWIMRRLSKAK